MTLNLYKDGPTWYFDDRSKNIVREAFVEGTSEALDISFESSSKRALLEFYGGENSPNSKDTISDKFIMCDWIAMEMREGHQWNRYCIPGINHELMLCPVLYQYFDVEPKRLWIAMMEEK